MVLMAMLFGKRKQPNSSVGSEQIDDITDDGVADVIVGTFNGVYYLPMLPMDRLKQRITRFIHNTQFWIAGDLNGDGYVDILLPILQ